MVPPHSGRKQEDMDGDQNRSQDVHIRPLPGMAENRAENELTIEETAGQQTKMLHSACICRDFLDRRCLPLRGGQQGETGSQSEKRLRETGMKDRECLL